MASTSSSKRTRPRTAVAGHVRHGLRESALLLVSVAAVFLLMALVSYHPADAAWSRSGSSDSVHNLGGLAGAWVADLLLYFVGYTAFLLPPLLAAAGWLALRLAGALAELPYRALALRALGMVLLLLACSGLAEVFLDTRAGWLPATSGGVLGLLILGWLISSFNTMGAGLLLLAGLLVGLNLLTGSSWLILVDATGRLTLAALALGGRGLSALLRLPARLLALLGRRRLDPAAKVVARSALPSSEPPRPAPAPAAARIEPRPPTRGDAAASVTSATGSPPMPAAKRKGEVARAPARPLAEGRPPLDLLDPPRSDDSGYSREVLTTLSRQVEEKLLDFGIEVQVVSVQPGPVITRFELQPAAGVKVSQITNLAKDLARGLSVIAVRVVEVIPGKSYIGLEIPNASREVVALREILESRVYQDADSPLTLALGKDIGGHPVVTNLSRMPHLLVAGTTGAGKSVAINAMLLSMLYKSTPREVRLILVDPKMLELSIYEGIAHLLSPVVTDMKDAAAALRWCVAEMERRYRLMAALKVRNIAGYNKRVGDAIKAGEPIADPFTRLDAMLAEDSPPPTLDTLPFLVVVIDELADLMMVVGKKVEELIARLAQKARAAGIHLILATQRPSVDVITGLIKANIPTRIAFQVSSKVDSRTILDQMGAETLLGNGDMLYLPPGTGFPQRLHGAFVDDHEVIRVVEHLRAMGEPDYIDLLEEPLDEGGGFEVDAGEAGDGERDALYDQAVRIVTESGRASASGIQRRLKIGYNRAARLIEAMETAGVVSPQGSNGMRDVLAPAPPGD